MPTDGTTGDRQRLIPRFEQFLAAAVQELRFDSTAAPDIAILGDIDGLGTARVAARLPQARITLIDPSEQALDAARRQVPETDTIRYRSGNLLRVRLPKPADAVIVLLAAHRMNDAQKIGFYSRAYQTLRPGGVLIHATCVAGEDEVLQHRHHWAWLGELRAEGLGEAEIGQALAESQEDTLAPLSTHLDWMRQIGLAHVDCIYRHGMFAVVSGEMPLDPKERPRNLFSVERMLKRR